MHFSLYFRISQVLEENNLKKSFERNPILQHFSECSKIGCIKAKNFFLGKWETSLPIFLKKINSEKTFEKSRFDKLSDLESLTEIG